VPSGVRVRVPPSALYLLAPGQLEGRLRSGSFVAPGEAQPCFAAAIEARFTRRSCTRRTRPSRYPERDPPQHGGARSTSLSDYSQLEGRFRSTAFSLPGAGSSSARRRAIHELEWLQPSRRPLSIHGLLVTPNRALPSERAAFAEQFFVDS
jgi:hypothetical protein